MRVAARNAVSLLLLLVLGGYLGANLSDSLKKQTFESKVRNNLQRSLTRYHGVYLADLRFGRSDGKALITVVLRTPYSFGPQKVSALQSQVPRESWQGLRLEIHVRSVITKEATTSGYLNEVPQQKEEQAPLDPRNDVHAIRSHHGQKRT
jgi:hypothetical protein